jgi:hypothetical protein
MSNIGPRGLSTLKSTAEVAVLRFQYILAEALPGEAIVTLDGIHPSKCSRASQGPFVLKWSIKAANTWLHSPMNQRFSFNVSLMRAKNDQIIKPFTTYRLFLVIHFPLYVAAKLHLVFLRRQPSLIDTPEPYVLRDTRRHVLSDPSAAIQ